ncbi:MAG: PRD domain-containing protein [Anaerolineaceae bacterium]|nr:PRD domain-containing protein [Anaerolineaceae bacterium]
MKKRQQDLLNYLMNSLDFKPIEMIADHFNVSRKTIQRDLGVIKNTIIGSGAQVESKRGRGIRLAATVEIREKIEQDLIYARKHNQDRKERNLLQAFFILFSAIDQIPLKLLGSTFFISRSQLLLDLKILKEIFDRYEVQIIIDREGVQTAGKDKKVNDLLVHLFSHYLDACYPKENIFYPTHIWKNNLITKQLITENDTEFLNHLLHNIEEFSSKKIWKQDYAIIFISLLVLLKRKTIIQPVVDIENVAKPVLAAETTLTSQIGNEIENEYKIRLNENDLETITNVLFSTGLVQDPAFNQITFSLSGHKQLVRDFSEDFIDAFTTITDIDLREKASFYTRILEHIEPMINRVLFNLSIADRFLETYAQEYRSTMNVCEVICWILSKKYGLPDIPRTEVLFLMLYIQTEIIEAESKLKVAFVSDDEKSVVNLQLARLNQEFPNWELFHYRYLNQKMFFRDRLDFVIVTKGSTVDCEIPFVEISHKMSELDLKLVKFSVFNLTSDRNRESVRLQNIFRDLLDLGCSIFFSQGEYNFQRECQILQIEGVVNCVYKYFDKGEREISLYVKCPREENGKFHFYFDMNNWDFLLFASKIVFLVDRMKQSDLYTSVNQIAAKLKENNV